MSASSTFVVFLQQKNKKKLEGVKLQPQRGAGLTYSQAAKQIATRSLSDLANPKVSSNQLHSLYCK